MSICTKTVARPEEYRMSACHPPMDPTLSKILQDSGWGNGFKIPFANEENKALEKELDLRHKRYVELASLREDDKAHLENVKKHFHRIQHDLGVYQHLITAKREEVDSAERADAFAARLLSHEKSDRDRTEKLVQETSERTKEKMARLNKRKESVLELMNLSEFNGRALEKWKEKTASSEYEMKDVQRFISEDTELNGHLDKRTVDLSATYKELHRTLDEKALDTNKLQTQFSRVSARFHKLHRYRNRLIRMWTSSVEAMKSRDVELAEIAEVYREARDRHRTVDTKIREREELLAEERRNSRHARMMRTEVERKTNETRQNLLRLQDMESSLRSDYLTHQGIVAHLSGDVKSARSKTESMELELRSVQKKAAAVEAECIVLQSRLEHAKSYKGDSAKTLAEMEEILAKQWEICNDYDQQIKKARQGLFEINALRAEVEQELNYKTEAVSKIRKIIGFYASKEYRNNELIGRLRGSIFQADLRATQLESRIDRIQSDAMISEHYLENQGKIQLLKKALEKTRKDSRFLSHEVEHDISMVFQLNRKIHEGQELNKKESQELKHLNLECTGLQKSIKQAQEDVRNHQVDLSMHKIMIKRLSGLVEAELESISSLSQQRLSIEGALKERAEEISSHTSLNKSLKKRIIDDIMQLKSHVLEIKKQLEAQKGSFRKIWTLFQTNKEGEISFTESVQALAREREELGQQKALWETKIEELRRELEGLRNNLKLMDTSNCQLKISMSPATPESVEHQKMTEMEAAEKSALVRKHHAKRLLKRLTDEAEILETSIHSVKQQILSVGFTCHAKMRLAALLGGEVITQQDKIHRWTNLAIMLLVEIKKNLPHSMLAFIEADLKLRFLEEKFEFAVVMLEKLIGFFPETKDRIIHFLHSEKMYLSDVYTRIAADLKVGFKANQNRRATIAAVAAKNVNPGSYANLVDNAHATQDERRESKDKVDALTAVKSKMPSRKTQFRANFSILKVDRQ